MCYWTRQRYAVNHTDSIVLLQKHGSNHRNATDSVSNIDLDFIIHPAAEIFRTKKDFKWGPFFCHFQDKYINGARAQVSELKHIGGKFVKQTTYIIMAMFDY